MDRSRRRFLKQSALLAASAVGGGLLPGAGTCAKEPDTAPPPGVPETLAPARKLPSRLKLSCAAYSFRQFLDKEKEMTLEEFIERCAAMGLDGTELTSYYIYKTDPESLARLKRKAFLLGLDISGTAVGNDFCKPSGPERDREVRHVKSWIEHAARLGAPSIRIFAGSVPKGDAVEAARARAVEAIEECCAEAGKHGIFLALENHGGITATAEDVLALCRAVKSPWFGVNLDTGNFHTDDPYRDLEQVAPHAVTVQLKTEVEPRGKGKVEADFERIFKMLRSANYRGYVALEYEAKEDPRTAVPRYAERLKTLLA